jgi:signal transduction histidine kinase
VTRRLDPVRRSGRAPWPLVRRRPRGASEWLALYVAARLAATGIAAALLAWGEVGGVQAVLLLYGPASTLVLASSATIRRHPIAWAADFLATLGLVLVSGDWRSPYYLMWLSSLALPAVHLTLRRAVWVALGATVVYLAVAVFGGPAPGRLQLISSETLAIHLSLPLLLTVALAYAADAMRRLAKEQRKRERLAIEAERRRIAWELHDSAKQRVHAAHLLVTSLQGRVDAGVSGVVDRAVVELESASSDMDTSLAELKSPLEGRRLDEALRSRAKELVPTAPPSIRIRGSAPQLPPLVGAHVYRIACEAITNALRHADAGDIDVLLRDDAGRLELIVRDDGRGLPPAARRGATGLTAMQNRAATIGARLDVTSGRDGGTVVALAVPLTETGGPT